MKHGSYTAKGFTLIELLVVVSIVAVLAALVLIIINPVRMMEESRYSTAVAAMNQVAKAAQLYEATHGTLPADASRNIPTEFMDYLGAGPWPSAPWPGSVYDWDNWTGEECWEGSDDIIQISVRDIKTYKGLNYSTNAVPISGRPQLALYYVVRGTGVPHCSTSSTVGFCVNCPSMFTPTP